MVDYTERNPAQKAKVPLFLSIAVKAAKHLPSELKQAAIGPILDRMSDEVLGSLVHSDNIQGARFTGSFLQGKGKPRELPISDANWEQLLKSPMTRAWRKTHYKNNWGYTSLHTEEKGWEVKQIAPFTGSLDKDDEREPPGYYDLYNVLGQHTTIARRPLKNGGYEYKIAEDFDFHKGTRKGEGFASSRGVNTAAQEMLLELFPDLLYSEGVMDKRGYGNIGVKRPNEENGRKGKALANRGKPVPIVSHYIPPQHRETEDMIMSSMMQEEEPIFNSVR